MKHYQKVGRIAHNTHPKDANIKVNQKGEIVEIVEGEFLDESKPDLKQAIDQRDTFAEEIWSIEKKAWSPLV